MKTFLPWLLALDPAAAYACGAPPGFDTPPADGIMTRVPAAA